MVARVKKFSLHLLLSLVVFLLIVIVAVSHNPVLATAWDISTASYSAINLAGRETSPTSIYIKPDGTELYLLGHNSDFVNNYNLSTAWKIGTQSYDNRKSISSQEATAHAMSFNSDGTKMYIMGTSGRDVNEYDLSTAWDVSTASYQQNFSVSDEDTSPTGLSFNSDGTKMYVLGDAGNDITQYTLSTAWDVSTATPPPELDVSDDESYPEGIFFKPDGTKVYVTGSGDRYLNEYDLSTAWDLTSASFNQRIWLLFQEVSPSSVFFKSDGTKMYITGHAGDEVNEYTLSTAWDISTASHIQLFSVSSQETSPGGLFFKSDGTKMYITGTSGDDVNEYDLSSAWDISTASYSQLFSVSSQEANPNAVSFNSDGTKMYIMGTSGDDINEYDLSTGWDVSTASYVQNFSVSGQDSNPRGLYFKPDGTEVYIVGSSNDKVGKYDLSTAWDISTASSQSFSVSSQETTPRGIHFKPDGTKMFIVGEAGDDVNEYSLSTAWEVGSASYVQKYYVGSLSSNPSSVFFRDDGTEMYVVSDGADYIYGYDLGTAWDISTASHSIINLTGREANPTAIYINPDGTEFYVVGYTSDFVNNYDLSTPWKIGTSNYDNRKLISSQEANAQGLFFKSDGTKMYVMGWSGNDVNEYSLSTAWDVETASYVQNFSVASQDTSSAGLSFSSDGTKMYVLGDLGNDVNEYNLSIAWDVSTASYSQNFSVSSQETNPRGIYFKPDGTKMYITGVSGDDVNEYDLSTAWDVSTASYVQNFFVSGLERNPEGIFFRSDGTEMYVVGRDEDTVYGFSMPGSASARRVIRIN